jgi:type II secretory pathway pseudopilin PulG
MSVPAAGCAARSRRPSSAGGFTTTELVVVLAIAAVVLGITVPTIANVKDASRVRHAAGYVASRFRAARQQAVAEERAVAVVFDQSAAGWSFRICADGNGNGVRRAEIDSQVDVCLEGPFVFSALFPGVAVAADGSIAGPEGSPASSDPVRFGTSDMASFSPLGSCTAGSLYLQSAQGAQYAIRVSGVLGRTRVLRYDRASQSWKDA